MRAFYIRAPLKTAEAQRQRGDVRVQARGARPGSSTPLVLENRARKMHEKNAYTSTRCSCTGVVLEMSFPPPSITFFFLKIPSRGWEIPKKNIKINVFSMKINKCFHGISRKSMDFHDFPDFTLFLGGLQGLAGLRVTMQPPLEAPSPVTQICIEGRRRSVL